MWLSAVLFTFIIGLVTWIVWDRKRKLMTWRSLGIPGPEPTLIWGNGKELNRDGFHMSLEKWRLKYGETFGYYEGPKPILVTSDLDLVQQIMVTQFHRFNSRKHFPFMDPEAKNLSMFEAYGERWHFLRSIIGPTFSSMRLKQMAPLINRTVDELMDVFAQKCAKNEVFDIYGDCQKLTIDALACCVFGIDVCTLKNPQDIFLTKCREISEMVKLMSGPLRMMITASYIAPSLMKLLGPLLRHHLPNHRPWFIQTAKEIIKMRQDSKTDTDRVDFIQLMLNASVEDVHAISADKFTMKDQDMNTGSDDVTNIGTVEKDKKMPESKHLTIEDMVLQCNLFLLAGYETTSTMCGFVCYELATHPDVQLRLQQEIDECFPEEDLEQDNLTVQKLPYMDMVIREALRLHPIVQVTTTRRCNEDCEIKGIQFTKGDQIQIHMNAMHFDIRQWGPEDPREFVPERFLPDRVQKRHPMAWIPFGDGPKNCLGMRFALMLVKITLVRVLKRYTIKRCDKTAIPLPVTINSAIKPTEGVWVTLEQRH